MNLLLESGIDSYIYHTVSHIIFHPKIYIFEGEKQGKIIVGSSNLTVQGLFQNMEASLVVDFEMNDKQGINLLHQIKNYYRFLLDKSATNVQPLTQDLIQQLIDADILPKEQKRRETSQSKNKSPQNQQLLSEVKKMFPAVSIPKAAPKSTKRKKPKTDKNREWQDQDPQAPNYRHPDIGSAQKDITTRLTDRLGNPVMVGDVVEWIASSGYYKGTKMQGVVTKLTHNWGGKTYKDGHPRYHVFANVILQGKDSLLKRQVKIEKVKKLDTTGNLAKQIYQSQKEYFATRKAMQKSTQISGKQILVWQKKNLPNSDAQQVSGKTNPTGVLRLAQARFKVNDTLINFKTYFRNEIFGQLNWTQRARAQNSPLEETHTDFQLEIDGTSKGVFNLRISHDPDRVAGQNNVPTTLHWGDAINAIREQNIKGKTLSLFQIEDETSLFLIKIE